MDDSYISDGYDYDSDKDKEYIPDIQHEISNRKGTRLKIRGRWFDLAISDSDSDINSNVVSKTHCYNDSRDEPGCSTNKNSKSDRYFPKSAKDIANTSTAIIGENYTFSPESFSKKGATVNIPAPIIDYDTQIEKFTSSYSEEPLLLDALPERVMENSERPTENKTQDGNTHSHSAEEVHNNTKKKLTRKRKINVSEWACNVRKSKFDQGLEYISSRKKVVPAKEIQNKKDCVQKCLFKCSRKISDEQRKEIFQNYYKLSAKEKKNYILNTTEVDIPRRRRKEKNENNSKKGKSFKYYFKLNEDKVQVCKLFYTGTLSISQKPIYTVHKHKTVTNTLPQSKQGKHQKRVTKQEDVDFVKEHINLFPRVESHYCRKKSNKEYIDGDLTTKRMYEMYLEYAEEKEKTPVTFCMYRKIFCGHFNIAFHKPRKDRCDQCEEMKLKKEENKVDEQLENAFKNHLREKEYMREEKQKDKESGKPILCFDLENVLTCPKADIKNFFYKSKLNVYNMTGHLSIGKRVYCAVWTEALHGRTGNDIASAVYKILQKVLEEHPEFEEIILWSDSCVPQNRNSLMSYALTHIIQSSNNLKNITMKFSVPGHSCIQEVDAIHSSIERSLSKLEYFSPVSLIRALIKVNRFNPYKVIQMQKQDFIDFQSYSAQLNYNTVPFSKVVCLQFSRCFSELKYKVSFQPTESVFNTANLHLRRLRRNVATTATSKQPDIFPLELKKK